ncbi:FkbM family methyltransferase [Nocardioides sp. L-11A]|uniref:FkbM family methyltransferase n=1 Tax=Nocardioides sp. L-11A TaxID=3043848 RepID=UPI00249B2127|nr:FkbM family methyltransferase [Nocardioides sp. L-11A]
MADGIFVSYAQNGEDVLLWRALGHVRNGRYVDVGAWDAVEHSVTKAFYDRGWRGVNVEPVPELAESIRQARPADLVVQAAVTSDEAAELVLHRVHQPGAERDVTGLSTLVADVAARHAVDDRFVVDDITVPTVTLSALFESELLGDTVHFLKVDVEGAEADVLGSIDFSRHRPWVVVVEATEPLSTEPSHEPWEGLLLGAGYEFAIFDGLSRYYVAAEQSEVKRALSYPVCVFDEYTTAREIRQGEELAGIRAAHAEAIDRGRELWEDVVHWRGVALESWAQGFKERERLTNRLKVVKERNADRNLAHKKKVRELRDRIDRIEHSSSWRVTRPLRWARSKASSR